MDIDDVTGAGVSIGKDKDGLAGEVWSLLRLNTVSYTHLTLPTKA